MSFLIRSACGPDVCLKMASPSSLYRPMLSLPYSLQRSLRMKRPTNSHTSASDNKCLTSSIIYNAQVTTNSATKNYIGLTEGTFKQRFSQHKATFKHRKYTNSTELSKYIWKLRDNNQDFNIKWTIISRARPYNNISKRCDLCLTEKLMIITANPDRILNKRSELISKCHHENKFYLRNN